VIESISISGVATFGSDSQSLSELAAFNFIFGPNGAGKTTISRVIADEAAHSTCSVGWKAGSKLQAMVYNRDFVAANFTEQPHLKGIFTLGEEHVEVGRQIEEGKAKLDEISETLRRLKTTLQGPDGKIGKQAELTFAENAFRDACWAQKQKHDGTFAEAFTGYRGAAEKFRKKVLQEHTANKADLHPLDALQKRAQTVFAPSPTAVASLPIMDAGTLVSMESNAILRKRVVGKDDVDIAAMIVKLGNSDWIDQGRKFYDAKDRVCPFCQQTTSDKLAASLEEYFDATFTQDTKAINDLTAAYCHGAARLRQSLGAVLATNCQFLDNDTFKIERDLIDAILTHNEQLLAGKKKKPSQTVELKSLATALAAAQTLLATAGEQVRAHNETVANIDRERATLTGQVWKYVVAVELKDAIAEYQRKKTAAESAIHSLNEQIKGEQKAYNVKLAEIRSLEKSITSIQPTIDAINSLLASFGFAGFKLAKAVEVPAYKIVRADGTDAKDSLSEGERTFITFLYFYHLIKGSDSESGVTTDRIVVIDDPVSSLDSDILFIVSSLIKVLCEEVRTGKTTVKQVFVLTHNVYFHKEVTFNTKRRGRKMREETFWTVRKYNEQSRIIGHEENPITSYYEMLWADVRCGDRDNHSIQNTLRKILENYFKFFGGVDPETICSEFEGPDRLICK
jgi:wobble nucleotide-excising tRNase